MERFSPVQDFCGAGSLDFNSGNHAAIRVAIWCLFFEAPMSAKASVIAVREYVQKRNLFSFANRLIRLSKTRVSRRRPDPCRAPSSVIRMSGDLQRRINFVFGRTLGPQSPM